MDANDIAQNIYFMAVVLRTGIEPVITPWEGVVLAAWPSEHVSDLQLNYMRKHVIMQYDFTDEESLYYHIGLW